MKYVYAGDRDISVWILEFLISQGLKPAALLVTGEERASHAEHLINLSGLDPKLVIIGTDFKKPEVRKMLSDINPDYIFGVHFPYIIPESVLNIPKIGFTNLHPAYLPYNRGWHTPSWAILENTPLGATFHFMEKELDTGDIIHQKKVEVKSSDTAHELYQRLKKVELETFTEAFPQLLSDSVERTKQDLSLGTSHVKQDLSKEDVQKIDLNKSYKGKDLIDKLRALTTNDISEAAYFIKDGVKYRLQIIIEEET